MTSTPRDPAIDLARPEDLEVLPEIERAASVLFLQFPLTADIPADATPMENFEHAQRAGLLWVARDPDGTPIGFALVERLGGAFHLEELDVLPERSRRGLGAALVRTVCEWVERQGSSLTLTTFREIPWNAPYYARLGFELLSPEQLPTALEHRIQEEEARGLAREHRVAMRWKGRETSRGQGGVP